MEGARKAGADWTLVMAFGSDFASLAPVITATAIVVAGVVDDLRSRKFHNWLFLTCVGVALAVVIATGGIFGVQQGILGFFAGALILLPFVLMGIIGAGDLKMLAAFGIVAGWSSVLSVGFYSLIWGAIFGLVQVILQGQLKQTLKNMVSVATRAEGRAQMSLHKMPFTIALLMGWLTVLVNRGWV